MTDTANSLHHAVMEFISQGTGSWEELLLKVHAYQRESCPSYGAYCKSFPQPATWRDIPALPLSAFRHAAIICFPVEKAIRTFRTSGTTGEGYGQHHFATLNIYRAAALGGWQRLGLPENPVLGLVPSPEEAPYSSLSCMAGWIVSPGDFYWPHWDRLLRRIEQERRPVTLFGTALAFLDLFEAMGSGSLSLPAGSAAMETGGYKGTQRDIPKPELYRFFTEKLGIPTDSIWNEYGMTELSSQFYSRGLDRAHQGAPWVKSLVIDPSTGQEVDNGSTGVLHIYDLANVDSCCAIQTRDLAVKQGEDFLLIGRDPAALPRGCSRTADELLSR